MLQGFSSRQGQNIFSFSRASRSAAGLTEPCIQVVVVVVAAAAAVVVVVVVVV
jgi:hypothetical protein